jgi:hypothetical protein
MSHIQADRCNQEDRLQPKHNSALIPLMPAPKPTRRKKETLCNIVRLRVSVAKPVVPALTMSAQSVADSGRAQQVLSCETFGAFEGKSTPETRWNVPQEPALEETGSIPLLACIAEFPDNYGSQMKCSGHMGHRSP